MRALAKAITWRLFGFISTIVIVYIYSKNIKEALMVGVGVDGVKVVLYYVHERIWNRVNFGRKIIPEFNI